MFSFKPLARKILGASLFASLTLTAIGFAHTGSAAAASSAQAEGIISTGTKFLGIPYRFGAPSGLTTAFDCSSFTQYVYNYIGIKLPRTSSSQATIGIPVPKNDLEIGDLVFFKDPNRAGSIGHVGIYAGDNKMLHTGGAGGVKFSDINSTYYKKYYVTARRVV
ncbi:C40 family peptidase [Cohnella pontilimi]|uniref:C40 family peptidase n=1 Tax=Cohnella pontilimi TaxID=2564100 RepID=UPI001FEC9F26|nr:C40 family peptidase [Cohnella pontilimi]